MTAEQSAAPTDVAQALFVIPQSILDAFAGIGQATNRVTAVVAKFQGFDYAAAGLVALGMVMLLLAIGAMMAEEAAKPATEFITSGKLAETISAIKNPV